MPENVSLLLGAGVSIPAGLPSTGEITNRLLKGKNSYFISYTDDDLKLILKYLNLVYKRIKGFYPGRSSNYEDIYYVTTQVKDFLVEYENPVVTNFAEDIIEELSRFYYQIFVAGKKAEFNRVSRINKKTKDLDSKKILSGIANMTVNYINDLTTQLLRKENINTEYLSFIREIINDTGVCSLNIFTLNHDLVIEKFLKDNDIAYHDGFVVDRSKKSVGNYIRVWQPDFINAPQKVKLLKLHGSIDWYKVKGERGESYQGYYFAQIENNFKIQDSLIETRPLILTGRFNKILEYNRSIYVDLHYNFYRLLPGTNILLISGYSFNDKGINSWLIDWMYAEPGHRITFIHPQPDKCIKKARTGIKHHWDIWQKEHKIKTVAKTIEKFSWKRYSRTISEFEP